MRRLTGALVLIVVLAAGSIGLAQPIGLEPLLRDPARYDQRLVVVQGSVAMVEGTPRAGAVGPQAFLLMDGGRSIRVTVTSAPTVRIGDRVEVEGLFKMAGNTIEAFRVTFR